MERAAFILGSPFQALCALEAKSYYRVSEAIFFLFDTEICHNKIEPLLKETGEVRYIKHGRNGTIQLIRTVHKTVKERFEIIFCGDYFSYGIYVAALCMARFKALFIYLDDGNSTLAIVPPISRKRPRSKNERRWYHVLKIYAGIMALKSKFFSIYDLGVSCPIPVEHNSFASLVAGNDSLPSGVFVIGTNSSKVVFRNRTYQDYLCSVMDWIKNKYGDAEVYYCPHRGDKNNWNEVVEQLGWKMFNTELSVEIDFILKGIYPFGIVGFGSTALLTLKMIFTKAEVSTVVSDYASEYINRTYRKIEEYYSNNNINSIHV